MKTPQGNRRSTAGDKKYFSIHRIQYMNIATLSVIIIIGVLFLLENLEIIRQSNHQTRLQASEAASRIEHLVRKQLPLRQLVSDQKLAVNQFAKEFELFVLEESGRIEALEKSINQMRSIQDKMEENWIQELPKTPLRNLRGNVNMALGIFEEAAEFERVGFGEMYRLAEDSKSAVNTLIREMAKMEQVMDRAARDAASVVFEHSRIIEQNEIELSELFNKIFFQNNLVLAALFILVVLSQLFFFFMLKRRLIKFSRITAEISRDIDLSRRIDLVSDDELGQMATSFNQMLESLDRMTIRMDYLDNIIQSMVDTVIVVNTDDTIRMANESTLNLLGYQENELTGKPVSLITNKEQQFSILNLQDDASCEEPPVRQVETGYWTKDGLRVPMLFSSAALCDDDGRILGAVLVAQDMTARKKMEQENKMLQAQLQHSLKMESIGTLTGGIAHDFNNILGVIIGNTELALDDIPEWDPAHSNLTAIKSISLKGAAIVKQLLGFSRKTELHLEPIDVVPVIKEALNLLRSTIPTTIGIQPQFRSAASTILADPVQINQIMMNLCINASQAMGRKTGVIEINLENITMDDDAARFHPDLSSGNYLRLSVSDNGPGIEPKNLDRIFDPYFTTKDVGEGSGMGLSVAQGIVNSFHGSITVHSELGMGSTFNLLFPLITDKPRVEPDKTLDLVLGNERILLVDDDKSILDVTREILKRLGYRVESQLNPVDAFESFRAKADQFDLLMTDMVMPVMTGAELSQKILEIRPHLPIIICTGHSEMVDEEQAKLLDIDAFVLKPIRMQEIGKIIRDVLNR